MRPHYGTMGHRPFTSNSGSSVHIVVSTQKCDRRDGAIWSKVGADGDGTPISDCARKEENPMFPLKTLVLAAVFAIVLGPHVNACPAHNHMQTVEAPAADETVTTNSQRASKITKDAQPAEVAAADEPSDPAAN